MQYGVLFYIVPDNDTTTYAALPLSEVNDGTLLRNIDEAASELWNLLEANPELESELKHRTLTVCMIPSYKEFEHPICSQEVVDWQSL